jgi:hypothetical protein
MATYILLDKDQKSFMGTDTFIHIDDRLGIAGKVESAIRSLTQMAGIKPEMVKDVRYMVRYNRAKYDYATYQYSGKLIPVKYFPD